ncbi:hypothetical protein ElyMa_000125900 [Elysia marginata]|uniref:Uncharacterized protein n=1 Tax=Elysia marginata TaxID=1093978 RepID=A0AAV4EMK4_9GAST|nr:hypothetical protein ElyMa_000125900 [Elysia marginata]
MNKISKTLKKMKTKKHGQLVARLNIFGQECRQGRKNLNYFACIQAFIQNQRCGRRKWYSLNKNNNNNNITLTLASRPLVVDQLLAHKTAVWTSKVVQSEQQQQEQQQQQQQEQQQDTHPGKQTPGCRPVACTQNTGVDVESGTV